MEGAMVRDNLILDRYEPLGMAGAGGFGTVQIAWDPRIQRRVAIKTIELTAQDAYRAALPGASAVSAASRTAASSGEWRGIQPWDEFLAETDSAQVAGASGFPHGKMPGEVCAFGQGDLDDARAFGQSDPDEIHALAHLPGLDEARTAAMLADPRIVTVYDFEVRGCTAYLIMEYVEGLTLSRLLDEYDSQVTLDVIAAVFDAVAGALEIAHDSGVLHLDIKPDNILVNARGEVKVTDFGLATLADASGAGTTGGGTIGYMPLEQMRREHLDARTDEWSLAAVTYEMLTGENPFRAPDLDHAEQAIEDAELVLPSLCWEQIDEQIDDVIFYALDPDSDERYASVRDFAEEAEKFLGDPVDGKEQLAEIVSDALGLGDDLDGEEGDDGGEDDAPERGSWRSIAPLALLRSMLDRPVRDDGESAFDEVEDDDSDWEEAGRARRLRGGGRGDEDGESPSRVSGTRGVSFAGTPREVVDARLSPGAIAFLARVFAIVASGLVAFFAASNMPVLDVFGSGAIAVVCAFALAGAGLGAVRPDIGALASFGLLGISLITTGEFALAVVLIATLAGWWYAVGRESMAASNVALAYPLIASVGGASAVPLLAGYALRPLQAVVTVAFVAVCALAFAAFGSMSLSGWDVFAHWDFTRADVTGNLVALLTQPANWLVIASWMAAAGAQSFVSTTGRRWLEVFGLVLAAAFVTIVAYILGLLTPQVVVSIVVALIALV